MWARQNGEFGGLEGSNRVRAAGAARRGPVQCCGSVSGLSMGLAVEIGVVSTARTQTGGLD